MMKAVQARPGARPRMTLTYPGDAGGARKPSPGSPQVFRNDVNASI